MRVGCSICVWGDGSGWRADRREIVVGKMGVLNFK